MHLLYPIYNTPVASKITLNLCVQINIYWKHIFKDAAVPVKDIFAFKNILSGINSSTSKL